MGEIIPLLKPYLRSMYLPPSLRIPLKLYHARHDKLVVEEPPFQLLMDRAGKPGHTSHQKILISFLPFATDAPFLSLDDQAKMYPCPLRVYFELFLETMRRVWGLGIHIAIRHGQSWKS